MKKSYFTPKCSLITHFDYELDTEVQTLMPNFRNSLYPYTSETETALNEFFIYSPSMDEEHIIRTFTGANEVSIRIDLHKKNGEYINSKLHYPNGEKCYYYSSFNVTRNGKYLYYLKDPKRDEVQELNPHSDQSEENKEDDIKLRNVEGGRTKDKMNPLYPSNLKQSLVIYEICFVRRKSMKKKLETLKKRMKSVKNKPSTQNKVQKRVSESEMMIELKLVREFKN